ncbi:hypothetical protein EON80_14875 [bacterium]|nr:MAG: hypothetical protein EON80_14875 [bacterium]
MRPDHERLSNSDDQFKEQAIEEALEGSDRAQTWADYVAALEVRQKRLERDLELSQDQDDRANLQQKLDEIDEQIEVLREEEKITKFIEDTVTFSYEVQRLSDG